MATAAPHDVMHPSPEGESTPHRLSTPSHHPLWSRRHSFRTSGRRVGALTTADHALQHDARHSDHAGTPFERAAHRLARALGAWLLASGLLFGAAARADVVTDWTAVIEETTLRVPDPALPIRAAAIMQLAVFEAVNAIVGDYEPYLGSISAPAGASPEAAAIAAAHRVLVGLLPEQTDSLDAKRAASLAAVPDGAAKTDGITVGEAAAVAMLAQRANDSIDADVSYTPGTFPGQYRPTPPDFTPPFGAHLSQVSTFAIDSAALFRVRPPPALRSEHYTRDYDEVKRVGDVASSERPKDRADVARFYEPDDIVPIYFSAARQVSLAQGKTLAENARIFALLGMAIFDAMVACFDSKYFYDYWRPVTAIRLGATDGNRETDADTDWAPFVFTPPFPSYPSGHASFGGAARRVLERMFGADGHAITLTSPLVPDVVLHYTNWKQITDDIDDARIYGGVHYRFDQEEAARQGRKVGRYVLRHWLRPVHRHGDETIAVHEQLQDHEEDSRDAD
jgi:hypothetical protein